MPSTTIRESLAKLLSWQDAHTSFESAVADLPAHLRGKPGTGVGVLAKAPKPIQETRVDLPTIGLATVEGVARAGLKGIVGEAGRLLVLDREATIALADDLGVFILGVEPDPS